MQGFNTLLGLTIVGPSEGRFIVELDADERHMHDLGQVHGGVYLALADTVMARAARARIDADEYVQTVDLRTSFLRPCSGGRIIASAAIIQCGRRFVFAEATLESDTGKILATSSASIVRSRF
ncbi:PaaI family thioesterase [Parasphingorhabdus sp.]|uniref:PaaI family thioesterase n=1 Tax=Parasphingorhabdus sp. TaxID=2709688 RepID=UPI003A90E68E